MSKTKEKNFNIKEMITEFTKVTLLGIEKNQNKRISILCPLQYKNLGSNHRFLKNCLKKFNLI